MATVCLHKERAGDLLLYSNIRFKLTNERRHLAYDEVCVFRLAVTAASQLMTVDPNHQISQNKLQVQSLAAAIINFFDTPATIKATRVINHRKVARTDGEYEELGFTSKGLNGPQSAE